MKEKKSTLSAADRSRNKNPSARVAAPLAEGPFPRSTPISEKLKRLLGLVRSEDTMAILINADPDAMASALALQRLLRDRVKRISIYRTNVIKRADNVAMVKLLNVKMQHIRKLDPTAITRWAIVDSQPHHNEQLAKFDFDIIIDHHPFSPDSRAAFVDVREEYGSTATMMTEYLTAAGIRPSPRLATALFYGIKNDTDNFVRASIQNDIDAFRYLYRYTRIHVVRMIESSEMTRKTLKNFRKALENLVFLNDKACIHMGRVNDPDLLVILADYFLKLVESKWCIVSGVYGRRLIVIFRNAGFHLDAGRFAQKLFGQWGSAGGHKDAARAEIPVKRIPTQNGGQPALGDFVLSRLKGSDGASQSPIVGEFHRGSKGVEPTPAQVAGR